MQYYHFSSFIICRKSTNYMFTFPMTMFFNNIHMNKRYLLIVIISFMMFSCNKSDFTTTSEPVYFGNDNIVNLSSDKQEAEVKASSPHWQMACGYDKNGSKIESDTIIGNWYTLIKKDQGESLLIKVENNNGEKRSLVVSIKKENFYTRVTINQEGK